MEEIEKPLDTYLGIKLDNVKREDIDEILTLSAMVKSMAITLEENYPSEYLSFDNLEIIEKLKYLDDKYEFLNSVPDEQFYSKCVEFFQFIHSKLDNYDDNHEILKENAKEKERAMFNNAYLLTIKTKMDNDIGSYSIQEYCTMWLVIYLITVESDFTSIVNKFVYLINQYKTPYYRIYKNKNKLVKIESYYSVYKENLIDKLNFLKDIGYDEFCQVYDRNLRNSIAHMNYVIFNDGSILYQNKSTGENYSISKEDLLDKLSNVQNLAICQSVAQQKLAYNNLCEFYLREYAKSK